MCIFIVEDDENIRELIVYALKTNDFNALGFENGKDFFEHLDEKRPNLVLLDIMLPGEDGLSILSRLRSNPIHERLPVIMLTAKGSEFDKVKGLDMGADDYITKPFGVMELISRIKAVLRRSEEKGAADKYMYKDISLDNEKHVVLVGDKKIALTYKEYELLYYLLANAEIVLSRDKIMESVWSYDFEGETRTLDMHIKTLRRKLGTAGECIKTIRGVGYKIGD